MKDWAKELPMAVTITDKNGIIIYMNDKSIETFTNYGGDKIIGTELNTWHNPHSVEIISAMINENKTNSYTISKNGVKKLIHQTPYYENGEYAGLVEFSIVLPEEMPHFDRG